MKKIDKVILGIVCTYIMLTPFAFSDKTEWALNLLFLFVGFLYVCQLVYSVDERRLLKENFKKVIFNFFTIIFLVFLITMILSAVNSDDKVASIKGLLRYFYYFCIYLLIRFKINKQEMYEWMIKTFIFSVLIVSIYGIIEFINKFDSSMPIEEILVKARSFSTFEHPNTLGAFLVLAIFPIILMAFSAKGWRKVYYFVVSFLVSLCLMVTFSRNAWLALALGILMLTILYNWKFIFLYSIPAIYLILSPKLFDRLKQVLDSTYNVARIKLWKIAEMMIKENFFFGVGSGNFKTKYSEYVQRYPDLGVNEPFALPPHNSYIRAFAELGVFGAVAFLILSFTILKICFYVKDKCEGLLKQFYSGFLISTACFLVMNCFDDLFYAPKVTVYFFIFVFIACNLSDVKNKKNRRIVE